MRLLVEHSARAIDPAAKRIDIPGRCPVPRHDPEALSDLDLSYTSPFGSPWDAVQMAAQTWTRQTQGGQPTQVASHEPSP
jgi:hypothetical protein